MSWVTFEVAGGGLVAVQSRHVVAIYDEQGAVKLPARCLSINELITSRCGSES